MTSNVHHEPRFEQTAADRLGDEISELCGYINAATCHLLELMREFDENQYWAEQGFKSCAYWLNFRCGVGFGAAREHLRVAKALAGLPKISEEFADGKLSFSKVRALTREVTYHYDDDRSHRVAGSNASRDLFAFGQRECKTRTTPWCRANTTGSRQHALYR